MAPSVPPNGPRDPSRPPAACRRRRRGWRLLAAVAAAVAVAAAAPSRGAAAARPVEWGATVLRINAGGADAGADGWTPDAWFHGGRVSSVAAATPIARTKDDAVLRTARYGRSFSYVLPMRPGVRASVAVMAAETWAPAFGAGRRVYNVLMGRDGAHLKTVHAGVDVYRRVGRRASLYLYTPPVTVGAEGRLVVAFRSVRGDAIVSGLIVKVEGGRVADGLPLAPAPTAPPGAPHLAHAVTGGPYAEYDYTGDGHTTVRLDGRGSHSHWDGRTKRAGRLVSYLWSNRRNGRSLCRAPVCAMRFPLGVTPILLTVRDSLGAVSSTATTVTVSDSVTPGLWCTFQKAPARGAASPPPVWPRLSRPAASWARRVTSVNLWRLPVPFAGAAVGVRCTGYFVADAARVHTFRLLAAGGVAMAVGGKQVIHARGVAGPARTHTAGVYLKRGRHRLLLTYVKPPGGASRLRLGVDAATPHRWRSLLYRDGAVVPTIHYLSTSVGRPYDVVKITGAAFRRGEAAYFGAARAATVEDDTGTTTPDTMFVRVPPGVAGTVTVTVRSANGRSTNGVPFRVRGAAEGGDTTPRFAPAAPLRLRGGRPWAAPSVTSIAYGPDGRLYLGTLTRGIIAADVDHATNVVRSWCGSGPVGPHRTILGIAFNPADWVAAAAVRVYVSTSTLYWGRDRRLPRHSGWHNGAVEAFVAVPPVAGRCLKKAATVVSGLPVSDHDHSVNGLAFTTRRGDLLIQVGGTTNAGVPAKAFENAPESVLSAASLLARTSKGAAFDGAITYSTTNPATAVQTGGRDVSVFASGLRNSLTVLPHSNGQIYATDNGPNPGFGRVRTSCTTTAKDGMAVNTDKLLRLTRGSFHGHPNLARKQCAYVAPTKKSALAPPPLALLTPSTNGLAEVRSNVFNGGIKGALLLSKFAGGSGDGRLHLARLSADGTRVASVNVLAAHGGLAVAVSPAGAVVMPLVQQGRVSVLAPRVHWRDVRGGPTVVSVNPGRGRRGGGYRVRVWGHHLRKAKAVTVGAARAACTGVKVESDHELSCVMPPGRGKVVVQVDGSRLVGGHDFEYMDV